MEPTLLGIKSGFRLNQKHRNAWHCACSSRRMLPLFLGLTLLSVSSAQALATETGPFLIPQRHWSWRGTEAHPAGTDLIQIELTETGWSKYEQKKVPERASQSTLSGTFVRASSKKRPAEEGCLMPEEAVYPLSGKRIGNRLFVSSTLFDDSQLPNRTLVLQFQVTSQGPVFQGGATHLLQTGEVFPLRVKLQRN